MTTITILGTKVYMTPDPAPPKTDKPLKSHHKHLDHAAEIAWGLAELADLADKHAKLPYMASDDPWQVHEWDEEYAEIPAKVTQAVCEISAHLRYLGEGEAVRLLGMGVDPKVMRLIEECVPGCLTGNWQWLAREVCPL